jgi:hypothetical protein
MVGEPRTFDRPVSLPDGFRRTPAQLSSREPLALPCGSPAFKNEEAGCNLFHFCVRAIYALVTSKHMSATLRMRKA